MALPRSDQLSALRQFPLDLRRLIEGELGENESLVWVGQPNPRRFARRSLPASVFGAVITTVSLFAIAYAQGYLLPEYTPDHYTGSVMSTSTVIGSTALLLGLGILTTPYWTRQKAKRIAYVITNQRAIIFAGNLLVTVRSFAPDKLTDLRRRQRADGSGDLIFEHRVDTHDWTSVDFGFECLDDVKGAEMLIRQLTTQWQADRDARRGLGRS